MDLMRSHISQVAFTDPPEDDVEPSLSDMTSEGVTIGEPIDDAENVDVVGEL